MRTLTETDPGDEWVLLVGGPADGRKDPLFDPETVELEVVMTDGQRHRYLKGEDVVEIEDGRRCTLFHYEGRHIGP